MLKTFEKFWTVAMLAYGTGAFGVLLVGPISDRQRLAPEGNNVALAANIGFHVIASLFYVVHAKKIGRSVLRTPWLFTLVFYAALSTAWSQDPALTFRRSIILLATTLFGIYLGSRFELREQIELLAWAMLLVLVGSLCIALAAPHLGVESSGMYLGKWRGLFSHKNVMARISVLGILAFLYWRPPFRLLRYAAVALGAFMLVMAGSGTGVVVLLALIIAAPCFRLIRTRPILFFPVTTALLCLGAAFGALLAANADVVLSLFGRNASLTGRTQLWQACWVSIMKRPLLGYGFDAFWRGMYGESASVISSVRWLVPTAHNGVLDLMLSLGACGLALFLFAFAICARHSFRFYVTRNDHLRFWPLAYMVFLFLYNLTEVTEMEQNSIFMMLFAALAATVTLSVANASEPAWEPWPSVESPPASLIQSDFAFEFLNGE